MAALPTESPCEEEPPSTPPSRPASRRYSFSKQGTWKDTLMTTYYALKTKVSSKSVELDHSVEACLLGRLYERGSERRKQHSDEESHPPHVVDLLADCHSVIWMTYRSSFPAISGTVMTTDCGWGCMVRSGQMILANALNIHLLGRDWRLESASHESMAIHSRILSWFRDDETSPFSLHNLMEVARDHGNEPGQWFGPSQVAVLIRDAVNRAKPSVQELSTFQVHLATDCTVYKDDVEALFAPGAGSTRDGPCEQRSVMLLIPIRLGVDKVNPIYIGNIKYLLSMQQTMGIIGGKPRHSLYFVGYQEDDLIYLDPHHPQAAVRRLDNGTEFDVQSYHCRTPRKLAASKMDPSCTFGMYCKDLEDFRRFCDEAEKANAPQKQKWRFPFFAFGTRTRPVTSSHSLPDGDSSHSLTSDRQPELLSPATEDVHVDGHGGFVLVTSSTPPS